MSGNRCYELLRLLFGMKNSGAMLVCRMRKLFQGVDHVKSYIDNFDHLHEGLGYSTANTCLAQNL